MEVRRLILFRYFYLSLQTTEYRQVEKETSQYHNVFYEQKEVCNRGRVRYQWDLARERKYPVSEEFAAVVCRLPAMYDQNKYFKFIESWGTVSCLNGTPSRLKYGVF